MSKWRIACEMDLRGRYGEHELAIAKVMMRDFFFLPSASIVGANNSN